MFQDLKKYEVYSQVGIQHFDKAYKHFVTCFAIIRNDFM